MEKREFLEKYIADRHNTNCSKWDGLKEKFGEDGLLPMWVADMEFKTCDGITREFDTSKLKRILQSLETGLFFCQIFVFII